MSSNNRTFERMAAALVLGLSLTFCSLPAPATAHAAQMGRITITQLNNAEATYDAYMLFKADIDENDQATHVSWASDAMKQIVLAYLDSHGYEEWLATTHPADDQHDRPQNACEYIAQRIHDSATDTDAATSPRTVQARTFANELARSLAGNNATPRQCATSGQAFTGQEGYYLFVTTDSTTTSPDEAGTAPMWIPLGGSVETIEEKSAIPTVDKEVREDSKQTWGKLADAHTNQRLPYRLTGTLPSNYGAFSSYHYRFTDTLESGLTVDVPAGGSIADALTVKVGGRDAPIDGDALKASLENNVLVVEFKNLKDPHWDDYAITANTTISVEYQAYMNESRVIGSPGNPNGVYLTYTDDPISDGDGRTKEVRTRAFAYKLLVRKVDEQTNEPLEGAGFFIRVADRNSDEASRGLYVQQNGSLAEEPFEFTTSAEGTFEVLGLDEGIYTISEVTTPEGWETIDQDITLDVSSLLDETTMSIKVLRAGLLGGDTYDDNAAAPTNVSALSGHAGSITITVTNDRWIKMPLTGQGGLGLSSIGGAALAIGAQGVLVARRRKRV